MLASWGSFGQDRQVLPELAVGVVLVVGSVLCVWAGGVRGSGRVARLAFAAALACAAMAELTGTASDGPWVAACALATAGIAALVLDRGAAVSRLSWLDATMGASSSAAVAVSVGADAAAATAAAGVIGGLALSRWRPGRSVVVALGGLVAFGAGADLAPLAALALGTAAWTRAEPAEPGPEFSAIVLSAILAFATAALTVLTIGQFEAVRDVAVAIAAVTVLAGMARAGLTVTERLRESQQQALTDDLTGLANRRHLMDRLRAAIRSAEEHGGELAFLLIDLDGFKELNDALGHHAGDQVLQQIGPRLAHLLREGDTLARLGGDEFAVVLAPGDETAASTAGLRLRAALEPSFEVGDIALHIDASIGIALFPEHATDAVGLLQRADVAMYEAKRMRTGHEVYLPSRDRHSRQRLALIGELHGALQAGQLVLHYQPKADLATGAIRGVEALVRWQHPQRGLLGPSHFLPLMEHSGLTRALTAFVLDRAIEEIGDLRRRGFDLSVAVNLGPADLLDLGLPSDVERLLDHRDFGPEHLELEVSEDVVMADIERTIDVMVGLRAISVRTALDDFGAGHAALVHLSQLEVDTLKIDRSFVTRLGQEDRDAAIVHSLVDLGRRLRVRVVAEGVESAHAWELLAEWRCDEAQGHFVAPPMSGPQLATWLRRLPERQPPLPDARLWAAVRQ
jgi:diguanylate cyclase (GGDEF)-like protein